MKRLIVRKIFVPVLLVACAVLAVCVVFKVNNPMDIDDRKQDQNIETEMAKEQLQQEIIFEEKSQKFIDAIDTNTELIALTEYGDFDLEHSTYSDNWNKWLTNSTITLTVEYYAVFSIPTNAITFERVDNNVVEASFLDSAFKVKAVEIVNKNIIKDRAIFGKNFSDAEKIAMESLIVDEIKNSMYNENNFSAARVVVESYYTELAEDFGVELIFK